MIVIQLEQELHHSHIYLIAWVNLKKIAEDVRRALCTIYFYEVMNIVQQQQRHKLQLSALQLWLIVLAMPWLNKICVKIGVAL